MGAMTYGDSATDTLIDGQEVTLVLRPEHIKLSREPIAGCFNSTMTIETIVNFGDSALVIGHRDGTALRVRVPGADVVILKEGDDCYLNWTEDNVYLVTE